MREKGEEGRRLGGEEGEEEEEGEERVWKVEVKVNLNRVRREDVSVMNVSRSKRYDVLSQSRMRNDVFVNIVYTLVDIGTTYCVSTRSFFKERC